MQGDSEEQVEFKLQLKKSNKAVKYVTKPPPLTTTDTRTDSPSSSASRRLPQDAHLHGLGWADDDVPDHCTDALDGLGELGPVTLTAAIVHLLKHTAGVTSLPAVSGSLARTQSKKASELDVEDEGYESDITDTAQDELFGLSSTKSSNVKEIKAALRRDFKALVSAAYRPGYVDAFIGHVITASIPVSALDIPPRSLENVVTLRARTDRDLRTARGIRNSLTPIVLFISSSSPISDQTLRSPSTRPIALRLASWLASRQRCAPLAASVGRHVDVAHRPSPIRWPSKCVIALRLSRK